MIHKSLLELSEPVLESLRPVVRNLSRVMSELFLVHFFQLGFSSETLSVIIRMIAISMLDL